MPKVWQAGAVGSIRIPGKKMLVIGAQVGIIRPALPDSALAMRLKVISCEVFVREMAVAVARSPNEIDIEFLPRPLESQNCSRIGEAIQPILNQLNPAKYDAVLLACGLCQRGVLGLEARNRPVVIPQIRDGSHFACGGNHSTQPPVMTLASTPITSGADSFGDSPSNWRTQRYPRQQAKPDYQRISYRELLDPDNLFLKPDLGTDGWTPPAKPGSQETALGMADYLQFHAEKEAAWFGWDFEYSTRGLDLFQRFLDGFWSHHEFLVVPPGWHVALSKDDGMLQAAEGKV